MIRKITYILPATLMLVAVSIAALAQQSERKVKSAGPPAADRKTTTAPIPKNDAAAREAFLAAYPVFMHARCMNCHPAGDVPLQGDDSHLHIQNVKRGADGRGKYALKCANCHQDVNLPGENMPPGHPNWHLPPPEMRMVFEGKSAGELCRQLKDPQQNGGKSLEEMLHHVADDTLVGWGWDPGDGRTKPPLPRNELARHMREWIENGAACPD
jgi:hypothetical protein